MGTFGVIEKTVPDGISLAERRCFLGMGFSYHGTPIDIIGLFLAGLETKKYSILLVDEFQRFNRIPEKLVDIGLKQTKDALKGLSFLYEFEPKILVSSEFMGSREYRNVLQEIEDLIRDQKLVDKLLQTVPEKHRGSDGALKYPLNEIACVEFLRRTEEMEVKIGPSKETVYDEVMRDLGLGIEFAYIIDAYSIGSGKAEKVIHYIPTHKAGGQRLFLDDPISRSKHKPRFGPDEASRYLLKLASVSGHRLGKEYLTEEEINAFHGKKLRKLAGKLVLENILKPYKEVVPDEY